jgi:hypothetical protein
MAGKSVARRRDDQAAQDADQEDRLSNLEQQQQVAAPPAAPAAGSSMGDQLNQLADLHQRGILTDDEFAAAKAKLLGT